MNLLKTSFWSAISTVFRMLAGIVTSKIMAIYIGPAGIAFLGNFNNIVGMLTIFSNGAIGTGITKYISEYESEEKKREVVSHALKITLFCSSIIGVVVFIFHDWLSNIAFGNVEYISVFMILGITVVFFGLNTTITAVLNGYKHVKYMVITGIISSILAMILAFIITIKFGLFGALINSIISQVVIFIINLAFLKKLKLFDFRMFREKFDKTLLWKLGKYGIMSFVSALVSPLSTLLIRNNILNHFSQNEAGYVQGMWSISSTYLSVITTTLSIYYLPTLSGIKNEFELRKEIIKGYKFVLPLAIMGGTGIYLFRDTIIKILYTPEFLPMREYFTFQILGDTLKIASWILSFLMLAKAMTRLFIITEIVFSTIYVITSFVFIQYFGSIGVTYAYALEYLLYLLFMLFIFRRKLFKTYS